MDTGSFPGVKRGQGVLLTTHPLLAPRSRKSIAIPSYTSTPLWATTRPVTGLLYLLPDVVRILWTREESLVFTRKGTIFPG